MPSLLLSRMMTKKKRTTDFYKNIMTIGGFYPSTYGLQFRFELSTQAPDRFGFHPHWSLGIFIFKRLPERGQAIGPEHRIGIFWRSDVWWLSPDITLFTTRVHYLLGWSSQVPLGWLWLFYKNGVMNDDNRREWVFDILRARVTVPIKIKFYGH